MTSYMARNMPPMITAGVWSSVKGSRKLHVPYGCVIQTNFSNQKIGRSCLAVKNFGWKHSACQRAQKREQQPQPNFATEKTCRSAHQKPESLGRILMVSRHDKMSFDRVVCGRLEPFTTSISSPGSSLSSLYSV